MATTTLTKNARTLIAANTSNAAGAATRGVLDLRTAQGGILTVKITNGGTGPTVQAEARVMIAHTGGATPAAAAAGADWKTVHRMGGGGTANGAVTELPPYEVGPGVMHLQVEISGNTGQAVTCEAFFSEITNASTA